MVASRLPCSTPVADMLTSQWYNQAMSQAGDRLEASVPDGSCVCPESAPPSCLLPGRGVRSKAGWGGDRRSSRHVGPCAAGHGTREPGIATVAFGGDQRIAEVRWAA